MSAKAARNDIGGGEEQPKARPKSPRVQYKLTVKHLDVLYKLFINYSPSPSSMDDGARYRDTQAFSAARLKAVTSDFQKYLLNHGNSGEFT